MIRADKNIKDYLHLYLGCDLFITDAEDNSLSYVVKFLGITESEVEPGRTIVIADNEFEELYIEHVKPVLRKLSSMTEEEATQILSKLLGSTDILFATINGNWAACVRDEKR